MSTTQPNFHDGTWVERRSQTCFMEHDRQGRDGRLLERVDKERLEQIARTLNERTRKGQLCPITPGHTEDDAPEHAQPPHWGYAKDFEVVWDDAKKKYVLKADWYIRREHYEAAKTFPNVSPEYWWKDGLLDPISLLRRTPKLDLGQWTYTRQGRVVRYAMENDMASFTAEHGYSYGSSGGAGGAGASGGGNRKVYEAKEDNPEEGGPDAPAADTTMTGACPAGVDPQFHNQYVKCMQHYMLMQLNPVNNAMGGGMSMPAPANAMTPTPPAMPPAADPVSRMQKNQHDIEVSHYARENEALKKKNADLEGRMAALEQRERAARYERDLTVLLGMGYQFDLAKTVTRCAKLDEAAFEDFKEQVKENYARRAGHENDELIQTVGGRVGGPPAKGNAGDEDRPLEQSEMEPYYRHQSEAFKKTGKYPDVSESIAYAKQQRNGKR